MSKQKNQEFETTIEKMERAIKQLQKCRYTRSQAINRLIHDFEAANDLFLAEYARKNLL